MLEETKDYNWDWKQENTRLGYIYIYTLADDENHDANLYDPARLWNLNCEHIKRVIPSHSNGALTNQKIPHHTTSNHQIWAVISHPNSGVFPHLSAYSCISGMSDMAPVDVRLRWWKSFLAPRMAIFASPPYLGSVRDSHFGRRIETLILLSGRIVRLD